MDKIIVVYWHSKFKDLEYEHNQEFKFSKSKRNSIIDSIIDKGYSVMVRPIDKNLIIFIDNGRFGQR